MVKTDGEPTLIRNLLLQRRWIQRFIINEPEGSRTIISIAKHLKDFEHAETCVNEIVYLRRAQRENSALLDADGSSLFSVLETLRQLDDDVRAAKTALRRMGVSVWSFGRL